MKVLCVCEHGNVRSVALAYLIKTIYKHEAIAVGSKEFTEDTFRLLANWADKIILLQKNLMLPEIALLKYDSKIELLDVGEDIWHNPFAQELQHKLLKHLKDLDL